MKTSTSTRGVPSVLPRSLAAALALALVAMLGQGSSAEAVTQGEIDAAKARYAAIQKEISAKQAELDRIQQQSNEISVKVMRANAEVEATRAELSATEIRLEHARRTYDERVALLDSRARQSFIDGGAGSNIDFLLSSASFGDFTDRLEFVDRLSAADADIAAEVQNLKTSLSQDARELERLKAHQQGVLDGLRDRMVELQQQFDQQQVLIEQIQAKRQEAQASIHKLEKQRRKELAAQYAASSASGGGSVPGGVFQTCPVGQPRAFGDDFGAPRYGGGYHLHAGNDILAPMGTPIYAPFDGTASNASNGLGGLSVYVHGAAGSVYNAHLSRMGQLGAVKAGDVIGYVGNSGDAQGGPTHDHFEWHPNSIPSDWPSSSYGHSVIGDAVNPYPLLQQVC